MLKDRKVLAIVQARGGSKSLPRKNIKLLHGIPLIAYSIAAALQSKHVTRTIVSTDDEEIAAVARTWGAETPFMRPSQISQDDSRDMPLFEHALKWLKEHENYIPDIVVQLRPTTPIRPIGLVDRAVEILLKYPNADSVRGVVQAGQNPHKMWRLDGENKPMKNLLDVHGIEEPYNAPRQILPPIFWQTGHIDAIRTTTILAGSLSGKTIYPIVIDSRFSIDIDTESNWMYVEWLLNTVTMPIVWPKLPNK